ncbi:MAG: FHA domain-containing protein, partial [Planctomycetes bacterium]|nr:FHA domain-containing protein [Planctomycetota bacterium]
MKLLVSENGVVREFNPNPDLGIIKVGRAPSNDLAIPDEKAASREHLTLERTVDGWKLVDQMSSNGTVVNDEKVNFAYLKENDVIIIGKTRIQVTGLLPADVAQASPAPGGAPVAARPARRAAPKAPRADRPEGEAPVHAMPSKKPPVFALAAAAAAVVVLGVGSYLLFSNLGGGGQQPEVARTGPVIPRQAELSEDEKAAIALAEEKAGSSAPALERLNALDKLAEPLKGKHGSVAAGRISDLRAAVLRELDTEVKTRVEGDLAAASADLEDGEFRRGISRAATLAAWLNSNEYLRATGNNYRSRIEKFRTDAVKANERWVGGAFAQVTDLRDLKRYDDALAILAMVLDRAWLSAEEESLYRAEQAKLYELKATSAPEETPVVDTPRKPSVLDRVKETKENLPGKNPLLADGARSEEKLLAALHKKLVAAAQGQKLTDRRFTYRGKPAQIKDASDDKITIDASSTDKKTGEEIPFRTRVKWSEIAPEDMLQLYDRVPGLTSEDLLAAVIFAFNAGLVDEASKRACALYKKENGWKEGIDILIATKRRMAIPEGGYIEFEGALIAPAERENIEFDRRLRAVLTRFEKNAGSKDRKKAEEAEKAFAEIQSMGERAVGPAVAILDKLRQAEIARAEAATGLLASDDTKMRALLTELDKRRAHALELIMDTVRYPYPYGPNQAEVQAEVNQRVAAVREIWNDPTKFTGQTNPEYEAILARVRAICERMAQLDPEQKFYTGTPEEDIKYVETIANKALSIRNYAPAEDKQRKALISLNREIMEYNEKFPTGQGHTDGDGREQVRITNEYRIMFGRVALKINDKLFWAAWHHSKWCVEQNGGQIAHDSPGGPRGNNPAERMRYEGYNGPGGENIHMNGRGPTAQSSHDAWCNSSGHHRNILHPAWRVLGSGKFG